MPVSISGTNGVTFPDSSLQAAAASPYVLKNRIINGDMRIDQRNAGASITATTSSYAVDRTVSYYSGSGSVTTQQSSIVPTGFSKSLSLTCVTGSSPTASQQAAVWQRIEGFNVADLNFGTANAQTITLSFWVRSSVTGTYCVYFVNGAYNRSYVATYTISAANTWEQKSITIVGDTSGTWPTDNSRAMAVGWSLGSGSSFTTTAGSWQAGEYQQTSSQAAWSSTTGATFYITGVQLEQNTSATPFERRLYGQELANCQRYYELCVGGVMTSINTNAGYIGAATNFSVAKRATPTVTRVSDVNADAVNTPFSEQISINGFRAAAQVTTSAGAKFQTLYKAEIEL